MHLLLGHALRKAVGLAARALGTSAEARVEEAGLELVGRETHGSGACHLPSMSAPGAARPRQGAVHEPV